MSPLMRKRTLTDVRSEAVWTVVHGSSSRKIFSLSNGWGYPFGKKIQAPCEQQRLSVPKKYSAVRTAKVIRSDKKNNNTAVRLLLQFVYKNYSAVQMAKGVRFSKGWYYPFRMDFIPLSYWLYMFIRSKLTFSLLNEYFCPYFRKYI